MNDELNLDQLDKIRGGISDGGYGNRGAQLARIQAMIQQSQIIQGMIINGELSREKLGELSEEQLGQIANAQTPEQVKEIIGVRTR